MDIEVKCAYSITKFKKQKLFENWKFGIAFLISVL
jgi:hypothetical protein